MDNHYEAVIFLAAGKQTRFLAPWLKCMSIIGGKPILQHAIEAWAGYAPYVVVSDRWSLADVAAAEAMGANIVHTLGRTIGESTADGLMACRRERYMSAHIVSADTFFAAPVADIITNDEHINSVYFDPWRWITVWYLRESHCEMAPYQYGSMTDRLKYAASAKMSTRLINSSQWLNVNTLEDLDVARGMV